MNSVSVTSLLASGLLVACASTQDPVATTTPARPPVAAPSTRRMTRAFNIVNESGVKCLRAGDRITVAGTFDGPTGTFKVARIAAGNSQPVPYAIETCVRVAAEEATVAPFLNPNADFEFTFASAAPEPVTTVATPVTPPVTASRPIATPSFVVGSVSVAPGETPIERLRKDAEAFNSCYDQALQREHTVEGVVELKLQVDRRGRPTRVETRVVGTNRDITLMQLVAQCIESHVRLIDFGEQPSNVTDVVVPMRFTPTDNSAMPIE